MQSIIKGDDTILFISFYLSFNAIRFRHIIEYNHSVSFTFLSRKLFMSLIRYTFAKIFYDKNRLLY